MKFIPIKKEISKNLKMLIVSHKKIFKYLFLSTENFQ